MDYPTHLGVLHSGLQGKWFFGYRARNESAVALRRGCVVGFNEDGGHASATTLTSTSPNIWKAMGLASTRITAALHGDIMAAGYTSGFVTGTVAAGDWLRPSTTHTGVMVADNTTATAGHGKCLAMADEASSGAKALIRVLVFPWRI